MRIGESNADVRRPWQLGGQADARPAIAGQRTSGHRIVEMMIRPGFEAEEREVMSSAFRGLGVEMRLRGTFAAASQQRGADG